VSKIFVCGSKGYGRPFADFGVIPKSYRCGWGSDERDEFERDAVELAIVHKIPMAGICRGGQLLTAMAGGALVQHCEGHLGNHNVETWDGRIIEVTSTHHQMFLLPDKKPYELLAWAEPKLSDRYFIGNDEPVEDIGYEPDCVYYSEIKALAMQYHPEYMPEDSDGYKFCQELIEKFLGMTRNHKTMTA
jgi:gamma-glutamyl-gamma-aminobutyrate hydrolase PuuD